MSQYTISLNEIVKIRYPETIGNIELKIQKLREILFNYNYWVDDDEFKELFETAFIIRYIESDINNLDVDLWIAKLKITIQLKASLYYKQWNAINKLKSESLAQISETVYSDNSSHTSNGESTADSTNTTKSSQFPQDINSNSFGDIQYMDAGSASESNSIGKSTVNDINEKTSQTIVNGNIIDKIEQMSNAQSDVITRFVNELNDLFMLIY